MSTKVCSNCKEEKSLDCFYLRNKQKPGKYVATCKPCTVKLNPSYRNKEENKVYKATYHKYNRRRKWERDLKKLYGLSVDDYEQMFKNQNGCCAICGLPESTADKRTGQVRMLAVDHCHKTNKIRALLCSKHNLLLGLLHDDLSILKLVEGYLVKYGNL